MTDRGPIQKSPQLDYEEKRVVVDLRRKDTREISLDDVAQDAKRRAMRRPKEIAAIGSAIAIIIAALAAGTVKVIGALKEHDATDELKEYRLKQAEDGLKTLQGDVVDARLKLEGCCP